MSEEEKPKATTDFVAGQNSVILGILNHLQADQRANHRENISRMDAIAAASQTANSTLDRHNVRITGLENYNKLEVEPLVNARKKRKWVWIGWTGGIGVISSPVWLTKLVPIFHSIFP